LRTAILVLLSTIGCLQGTVGTQQTGESRDKDVYTAVLDSLFTEPDIRQSDRLVVGDSTSASVYERNYVTQRRRTAVGFVAELFSDFGYVDTSAVRSFENRNRKRLAIPQLLLSRAPVVRVKTSTMNSLPGEFSARWRAFYELYPRSAGLISLSTIGYSSNGDVAIVMIDRLCGRLCGHGYLIGLRREAGKWYVASIKPTWVS
jgi:hypothetical protein